MGHNPYHGVRALQLTKARLVNRIKNANPALAAGIEGVQLNWYRVRNAAEQGGPDDTTEVFIYDEIGGFCGIDASQFVQDIQDIDTPNIVVRINSPGGSLFDGIAIYNSLVQHKARVTTRVDAIAASAASIIAMAGRTVEMMNGSQLMIHDAMGVEMGNAREMRAMADFLDKQSDNIASVYAAKSPKRDASAWRELMLAETWMFADDAINVYGLADSVYTRPESITETEAVKAIESASEMDEEDDDPKNAESAALAALMQFDHIANGSTRKYRYPSARAYNKNRDRDDNTTAPPRIRMNSPSVDMRSLSANW